MSPLKKRGPKKYFNFNINAKSITGRGVRFSPDKRVPMARYQEQKVPVKISSFRVNEDSLAKDVILDYKTQLSQVTLNAEDSFNPIIVPSDTITPIESLQFLQFLFFHIYLLYFPILPQSVPQLFSTNSLL